MGAISFKVTIPTGSLLEQELRDKTGRQRTLHLYLLGELGVRTLKNLGGSNGVNNERVQIPSSKTDIEQGKSANKSFENKGFVVFDVGDLMSA